MKRASSWALAVALSASSARAANTDAFWPECPTFFRKIGWQRPALKPQLWTEDELRQRIRSAAEAWAMLRPELQSIAQRLGGTGRASFFDSRIKSLASLREKLVRKSAERRRPVEVDEITDVLAFRYVVKDPKDIPTVLREINRVVGDHVIEIERKATDRGYYGASHLLASFHGEPFEIQVMSQRMADWSKWNHDFIYKMDASVKARFGPEYVERLRNYSRAIGDYLYQMDTNPSLVRHQPRAEDFALDPADAFPLK